MFEIVLTVVVAVVIDEGNADPDKIHPILPTPVPYVPVILPVIIPNAVYPVAVVGNVIFPVVDNPPQLNTLVEGLTETEHVVGA